MTKQELKDSVALVVKANGENEITGTNLQAKLFEIIDECYGVSTSLSSGGDNTYVSFNQSKYYGTVANPTSGNITYNMVDVVAGMKAIIFHQDNAEPIFPNGTYKLGPSIYVPTELNIITITYIDAATFFVEIHRTTNIGLTIEVQRWMEKGGVASGFVLTALNQFMLDIAPMRNKILRFNPLWGETFNSVFIPLIVNEDGGDTPLGSTTDYNYGFIVSDWAMLGNTSGLNVQNNVTKYIDTGFVPSLIAQFGINNASFGVYNQFTLPGDLNYSTPEFGTNPIPSINEIIFTHRANRCNLNGTQFTSNTASNQNPPIIVNRNNNTTVDIYNNGVKSTFTSLSTGKSNSTIKACGRLSSSYASRCQGGYYIGKAITDAEEVLLRTAWITLITKLNR